MFENSLFPMAARPEEIRFYAKVYRYPDGSTDLIAASAPVFKAEGWEERKPERLTAPAQEAAEEKEQRAKPEPGAEARARSMRRARARVRRLALANEFRWFVTLTLNQEKVDRMEGSEVVKKLNVWCSNMVQRRGLKYILVPERHKKGGIHFHGFFNDVVEFVDSGHKDKAGHTIYNLPDWDLGFTTAIELYGGYSQAVAYVCKYIGKQGEKPAGRWYYSGGGLNEPVTELVDISAGDLIEEYGSRCWTVEAGGRLFAGVNGLEGDNDKATMV